MNEDKRKEAIDLYFLVIYLLISFGLIFVFWYFWVYFLTPNVVLRYEYNADSVYGVGVLTMIILVIGLAIFSFKLAEKIYQVKEKKWREDLEFANYQIEVIEKELVSMDNLIFEKKMPQSFLEDARRDRNLLSWYLDEKEKLEKKLGIK